MAFYNNKQEREFEEKVVQVRRVCKVVTGGKRFGFRVLAVVGDKKGRVGMGVGKSGDVSVAIRKAVEAAKKAIINVTMVASTIPHDVMGKLGASNVMLRPAKVGRGVIAGGAVRVILELAGIKDIVAKSIGSSNAINSAKATIDALQSLRNYEDEKINRGKEIEVRFVQSAE
ncbi:MAG: SSU ribosomal protein S5P [Candidatus Saganbacteria bacterium]|uniref:Small ribosomal subunit protein uS5 n=1 Tax=Candidatus Saganbacteria bacterium TaxID=2575572 RepID=A0A833L173_UNCSA|nr:MAG: SSU ribosomal protein S5P [Candidatus Saganbacteria bacterium]